MESYKGLTPIRGRFEGKANTCRTPPYPMTPPPPIFCANPSSLFRFFCVFTFTLHVGETIKVDICKLSFKSTSLRLKCAIQRSIASEKRGWGAGSTGGFLKYVVDPGGELRARALPPPLFCTRSFDENSVSLFRCPRVEGTDQG